MWIRVSLLLILITAAILNAYLRHWGAWSNFIGILILQAMAIREIWAYLFNKTIWLWSGPDIKKKGEPLARVFACGFYFVGYLILFLKN